MELIDGFGPTVSDRRESGTEGQQNRLVCCVFGRESTLVLSSVSFRLYFIVVAHHRPTVSVRPVLVPGRRSDLGQRDTHQQTLHVLILKYRQGLFIQHSEHRPHGKELPLSRNTSSLVFDEFLVILETQHLSQVTLLQDTLLFVIQVVSIHETLSFGVGVLSEHNHRLVWMGDIEFVRVEGIETGVSLTQHRIYFLSVFNLLCVVYSCLSTVDCSLSISRRSSSIC